MTRFTKIDISPCWCACYLFAIVLAPGSQVAFVEKCIAAVETKGQSSLCDFCLSACVFVCRCVCLPVCLCLSVSVCLSVSFFCPSALCQPVLVRFLHVTCHSKFCTPWLEHCWSFQHLLSSENGHYCIVCDCTLVSAHVLFSVHANVCMLHVHDCTYFGVWCGAVGI